MRRDIKGALDRLHQDMDDGFSRLVDIHLKLGFLLDVECLFYSPDCEKKLKYMYGKLGDVCRSYVDGKQLYGDIIEELHAYIPPLSHV